MEACFYCGSTKAPPFKYGGKSEPICYQCAMNSHPPRKVEPTQNRNDLCNCGSGLKFKKCCLQPHK